MKKKYNWLYLQLIPIVLVVFFIIKEKIDESFDEYQLESYIKKNKTEIANLFNEAQSYEREIKNGDFTISEFDGIEGVVDFNYRNSKDSSKTQGFYYLDDSRAEEWDQVSEELFNEMMKRNTVDSSETRMELRKVTHNAYYYLRK